MAPSRCLYSAVSSNSSKSLFPHILTLCSSSASIRLPLHHAWMTGALLVSLGQLDNANLTYAMYPVCMATSYFTQYSTLQLGEPPLNLVFSHLLSFFSLSSLCHGVTSKHGCACTFLTFIAHSHKTNYLIVFQALSTHNTSGKQRKVSTKLY